MFARVAPLAFVTCAALALSADLRAEPDAAPVKVSGTVTFDGKPLDGATVTFHPEAKDGKKATGKTDANGNYTLKTDGAEGAAPGKHRVLISLKRGEKELIPLKYSDRATTPLVVEVAPAVKQYDLNLTK
jgi:hypothetical protein